MIFTTLNSTYEVDRSHSRIRRLTGSHTPTRRQGKDQKWKSFTAISPIIEDDSVTIVWKIVDGFARATKTSVVQEIVEDEVIFD